MASTTSGVTDTSAIPDAIRKLMQPSTTSSEGPSNTLGKDDFLKLMMTQLEYQDPLNATDDKEFISQLAQFSSLEQTTKLADNLGATMQFQQLSQVSGLVGMPVQVNEFVNGDYRIGIVEQAKMVDGAVKLKLAGTDTLYDPTEILAVIHPGAVVEEGTPTSNTSTDATTGSTDTSGGTTANDTSASSAVSGQ